MKRPPKPEGFILHLVPPGKDSSDEAYRRLRAGLKALWRSYGLRCTRVSTSQGDVTVDAIERCDLGKPP